MEMEMQVVLQLMKIWVVLIALSVHGSADLAVSPKSPSLRFGTKRHAKPEAKAPQKALPTFWPTGTGHSPSKVPFPHKPVRPSIAVAPSAPSFHDPAKKRSRGYAFSPSVPYHKHHHGRNRLRSSTPKPSYKVSPAYSPQGSSISPNQGRLAPSPLPSPSLSNGPVASPAISPLSSSLKKTRTHPPPPVLTLPPPPPNQNCASVTCPEPLTYAPPGLHCGCVMPIQVKLHLSINLYTFFPLVSELAKEIAASLSLNHSQVRIMGANEAKEQLDKTAVLVNLVPLGGKFGDNAALSTYKRFFHKKGSNLINTSLFGAYEVIYVRYPGLPPSPPSSIDHGPYSGSDNGRTIKPLGVQVPRMKNDEEKKGMSKVMVAMIVLSSFTAFVICLGASWLLVLNFGAFGHRPEKIPHALLSSPSKPSGSAKPVIYGSKASSSSLQLGSSTVAYTGSAKTFTLVDIERATNKFDASRIVGEGGFGIVYRGVLDDGREVAVKVLKRVDQRGGCEFLSEVEMLGRLHHRNLVKLIAICTEGHIRCLVYELVPNGSVESHLHGVDKENGLLDWDARVKIALGAARGLAYLHEDSSPPVIHRDFKSSNILLEHDFTPKVSDFGLARAAHDEGNNKHISTRVMGTFGYLAPEYAMTGHLLVKSDVYSYGVVLLELLTGRKPVDLSQPPGQENLVAWAHPLLTSKELLETIIDPSLKTSTTLLILESVSKVAAIASMCVQAEVSNRPFMGEVVQALQLVCSENDEKSFRQELITKSSDNGDDAMMFEVATSGSSSSGKMGRFWERLRGGSISESEHESSHKLWPGSD